MATVASLGEQIGAFKALLGRLMMNRPIRDPFAQLHPDLTGPQIHVIANLAVGGQPMSMNDLAERICASAPTMTGIIDRLERQGLVARERGEADRRVVLIRLTEAGMEAFHTLDADMSVKVGRMLEALDAQEREQFLNLLNRIVTFLIEDGVNDDGASTPQADQ